MFILHSGSLPYIRERYVENLLSLVPSGHRYLLVTSGDFESSELPPPRETTQTRILRNKEEKCKRSDATHLSVGPYNRRQLIKILMESEKIPGSRRIQDIFGDGLFVTDFYVLSLLRGLVVVCHMRIRVLAKIH